MRGGRELFAGGGIETVKQLIDLRAVEAQRREEFVKEAEGRGRLFDIRNRERKRRHISFRRTQGIEIRDRERKRLLDGDWQYADSKTQYRHTGMLIHNIETGELFSSIQEAANKYGCDRSSISAALRGKSKKSQGCHWEFVEKP